MTQAQTNQEITRLFEMVDDISKVKGRRRNMLRKHWRRALRVIDADSQVTYANTKWRYGAGKTNRRKRSGKFRDFASKATAFRYQWKQSKKYNWSFRSMMKRKGRDNIYQGNLAHLVEDGAKNKLARKQNAPWLIRRKSFQRKRLIAMQIAVRGIEEALRVSPK